MVAVLVAAAVTAVLLGAAGVLWWLAAVVSLVVWIGLAVLQEHDERGAIPPDERWVDDVRKRLDSVLADAGFEFAGTHGRNRARGGTSEGAYYLSREDGSVCLEREVTDGSVEVVASGTDVEVAQAVFRLVPEATLRRGQPYERRG